MFNYSCTLHNCKRQSLFFSISAFTNFNNISIIHRLCTSFINLAWKSWFLPLILAHLNLSKLIEAQILYRFFFWKPFEAQTYLGLYGHSVVWEKSERKVLRKSLTYILMFWLSSIRELWKLGSNISIIVFMVMLNYFLFNI